MRTLKYVQFLKRSPESKYGELYRTNWYRLLDSNCSEAFYELREDEDGDEYEDSTEYECWWLEDGLLSSDYVKLVDLPTYFMIEFEVEEDDNGNLKLNTAS